MERMIRFFKSRRGQSLVEMALVLPILLLLVAGAIDLGRAFNAKITITNAAREGARVGSRYPEPEQEWYTEKIIKEELTGSAVHPDDVEIVIEFPEGGSREAGDPIRVTVRYELPTILGSLVGTNEIEMQSANEMVIFGLDWEG